MQRHACFLTALSKLHKASCNCGSFFRHTFFSPNADSLFKSSSRKLSCSGRQFWGSSLTPFNQSFFSSNTTPLDLGQFISRKLFTGAHDLFNAYLSSLNRFPARWKATLVRLAQLKLLPKKGRQLTTLVDQKNIYRNPKKGDINVRGKRSRKR